MTPEEVERFALEEAANRIDGKELIPLWQSYGRFAPLVAARMKEIAQEMRDKSRPSRYTGPLEIA